MAREVKDWITINGQHVPIYEGESKQDAYNRSVAKYNEDKKESDIAKQKEQVKDRLKAEISKNKSIKDTLTGKKSDESLEEKRMKWLRLHGTEKERKEANLYFLNKEAKEIQAKKDAEKTKRKEQEKKREEEKATYDKYLDKEYKTVSGPGGSAKVYIKNRKTGEVTERYFDYARDAKRWAWERREFEKNHAKKQRDKADSTSKMIDGLVDKYKLQKGEKIIPVQKIKTDMEKLMKDSGIDWTQDDYHHILGSVVMKV